MTVLATAAVEVVAETDRFEPSLNSALTQAGASADRASTTLGRRIGRTIGTAMGSALGGLQRVLGRPLAAAQAAFLRVGRAASSMLAPAAASLGAFATGLRGISAAATGAAGRFAQVGTALRSVGATAATAFTTARANMSLLVQGIRSVGVQASAASAPFYRLGTTIAGIGTRAQAAFARIRAGLDGIAARSGAAERSTNLLASSLGRMAALGAGLAAATGIADMAGEISRVASSAQTTEASLTALYRAAGGGAAEVNEVMAEMQERFRGLDMSAMNAGATALAYMGVQGEDAVNVLDNLQKATTASGTGVDGLSRAFDAMTQGVNAGKFQMDTLNQISDAGIPIYDALADVLGTDIPTAQKMASDGAIGLEDVLKAMSGEFGVWFPALLEGADNVSNTFAGSWDTIRNTFVNGVANELVPLLDKLAPLMADLAVVVGNAFEALPGVVDSLITRGVDAGIFDALREALIGIREVVIGLGPAISGFVGGMTTLSMAFAALGANASLGEALQSFGRWLQDNAILVKALGAAIAGMIVGLRLYRVWGMVAAATSRVMATGFRGIGVAIRGIPLIGWVLAAISALITLYQTSETFRGIVNRAWMAVKDTVQAAWEYIQPAWEAMAAALSDLWDSSSGWEGWSTIWSGITDAVTWARDAISEAWDVIGPALSSMGETLSGLWESISGWEGWSSVWSIITTTVSTARDVLIGAWEAIASAWDALTGQTGDTAWWTTAWDTITGAVSTASSIITGAVDAITEALAPIAEALEPVLSTAAALWTDFIGLFSGDTSFADISSSVGTMFDSLVDLGQVIAGVLIDQLSKLPGLVGPALLDLGETVAGWFLGLPELVGDALATFGGWVADWFADLPGLVAAAMGKVGGIVDWLADVWPQALEYLTGLGSSIAQWFLDLPAWVRENIDPAAILSWLQGLGPIAVERLVELGTSIINWFKGLPAWVRENIDPAAIIAWLQEVPGRVIEFMQNYGPQILKGFAVAIGIVIAGIPALLLGLLAAIMIVFATIAGELLIWAWGAFSNMMATAGRAVLAGINSIVLWFAGLPARVMAAIAAFGARLAAWGTGAMNSLRGALAAGMATLRSWWTTSWNTVMGLARGVWNSFVAWVTGAAGRVRDGVMGPINTLRARMIGAFNAARVGIANAWSKLRRTVGQPIEWVVNTAYNSWLRGVWGKVVDKFGGPSLPSYTVKFASGGIFPGYTPGRDVHAMPMAAFSGGESVLRPEVTKAWGARTTLMLNKLARTGGVKAVRKALMMLFAGQNPFTGRGVPAAAGRGGDGFAQRFASGGILSGITGKLSGVASWLNSKADDFGDGMIAFIEDPGGTLRKLFEQIMDYSKMPGWGTKWTSLLSRVPKKIIDQLVKKAKDLFSFSGDGDWMNLGGNVGGRLGAALAFAKAQRGKPYVWGGVGPRGYDCCIIGGVRIYGPHGAKKIEDMRPGDHVYSYVDGRLEAHQVNAVWQSEHQEVFAVRTRNRKVTASANHPFMRLVKSNEVSTYTTDAQWHGPVNMPRGSRGTMECTVSTCTNVAWSRGMCNTHLTPWRKYGDPRIKQVRTHSYKVEWARVDELQRGDLLVQPRQMPDCGKPNPLLPGGVPVSLDLAWLIGAMTGDGTVTDKGIRLALYGDKREKATRILRNTFGGNPSHGESYGIVLSNVAARDMFTSIGMRRLGPDKRVPDVVWEWSRELQQAFLDGYCDADGHRPPDPRRHGERTYHSASEDLIEDVRALHIILGDPVSNVSVTERTKPIVIKGKTVKNARPQYGFTVWRNSGRGESAVRNRPGIAEWLDSGDFTVAKVLDVTSEGTQDTWDMEVDQAHNFVADGVVVHNSGFMSAIHNVILGKNPYSRRYTTHSFVGTTANGFRRNMPSPFTIGNTHANVGHMAGTLLKVNVESRGSRGVVVGPGARGTSNPLFTSKWGLMGAGGSKRSKMGGEGILYDSGGVLAPGWTAVFNGTRRPETVRTYAQEERVARLVKLVESNAAAPAAAAPLVPANRIGELAAVLGDRAGGGTTINAPVTVQTYAADPETVAYKVSARIARLAGV